MLKTVSDVSVNLPGAEIVLQLSKFRT